MKIRHISEVDLSTYLDDAADDPLAIAQHLAVCSECAHRYSTLRDLAETLHALPDPEVRPEFLTRIMAHVRETEMVPERPYWLEWLYTAHKQKLGLIAAGGCLIVALAVIIWATPQQPSQTFKPQNVALTAPVGPEETMDPAYAASEMLQGEAATEEAADMDPLSDVEIILALSKADWFETSDDTMENRMDTNAEFSEEFNVEAEDIVYDFLQEGSVS